MPRLEDQLNGNNGDAPQETVAGQDQLFSPAPEQDNNAPTDIDFVYEALEKSTSSDPAWVAGWLARRLRKSGIDARRAYELMMTYHHNLREPGCSLEEVEAAFRAEFPKYLDDWMSESFTDADEDQDQASSSQSDSAPAEPAQTKTKRGRPKKPVDKKLAIFREALTRAETEDPVKVGEWLISELKSVGIPSQVAYNTLLDYLTYSQNLSHHEELDKVFRNAFPGSESLCRIIELPPGVCVDPASDYFVDPRDGRTYRFRSMHDGEINVDLICEGYAFISEETRDERGEAEFTIEGRGAVDGHQFKFDISGRDFSDPRTLRAALVAHFGASNRVMGLKGDVIQSLSLGVVKKRLITKPGWLGNRLVVPGLEAYDDLKLRISNAIPADVSGGDVETGLRALRLMLEAWHEVILPLTAVIGSPLVAKYMPDDRFGILLTGMTGMMKTEMMRHCMAIYGNGYLKESNIVRFGEGATANALMKLAADSGCLPFFVDNYKPIKKDDPARLVSLIHAVLEGSEKRRLTKEAEHREANEFSTTLLMTGEDLPTEASTLARVLPVSVEHQPVLDKVTELQAIAEHLPAVGRLWCQYLTSAEIDLSTWRTKRQELVKLAKESGGINPGRIGTTAATLWFIWKTALQSPLGEVLREFNDRFEAELQRLIVNSAQLTAEFTDAERFVDALRELIATGRVKIENDITIRRSHSDDDSEFEEDFRVVGWMTSGRRTPEDPIIEPKSVYIYPDIAFSEVKRYTGFEPSVSKRTLYRQLDELGYLIVKRSGNYAERLVSVKMYGKQVRVLRFKPEALGYSGDDLEEIKPPKQRDIPDNLMKYISDACSVSDT